MQSSLWVNQICHEMLYDRAPSATAAPNFIWSEEILSMMYFSVGVQGHRGYPGSIKKKKTK